MSLPLVQITPIKLGKHNYTIYIKQKLTSLYPIVVQWEVGQARMVLLASKMLVKRQKYETGSVIRTFKF